MTPALIHRLARMACCAAAANLLTFGMAAASASTVTVRAWGSVAGNVWPQMELRHNGKLVKSMSVQSTALNDFRFLVSNLRRGSKLDVVFTNDAVINGQDRNLGIAYITDGTTTLLPNSAGTTYDRGAGSKAFDGQDVVTAQPVMAWAGALRFTWPAEAAKVDPSKAYDAARFLLRASFGPKASDVAEVQRLGASGWINKQTLMPSTGSAVGYVQGKYALGDAFRPGGASFSAAWPAQKFWANAATAPDQLRKRMAFALHQVFMVSAADSNLNSHTRAFANYLDLLDKNALGNFRDLLQDMALSPAMGIYLSHLRNRKEDPASGRQPDENFAREVMQLFTIGLHELNPDGTRQLAHDGQPIETYDNADVMALAKVFTGWSWSRPDNELTESNFRYAGPNYTAAKDQGLDLLPMKPYPGQHSLAEKPLFAGKPWARTIPAGTEARESLRLALDTLFMHPNVGPFIGRQLIQHLVTSQPSPAYIGRVTAIFNNNGKGVRGDLAAVARAVLLDPEARAAPGPGFGKLREPVLRVAQWMRAFGAQSSSGDYMVAGELKSVSQQALYSPSVFGYFRPDYVPPASVFSTRHAAAPEFQIVNESSTAAWVNTAQALTGNGLGWNGSTQDVRASYTAEASLVAGGNPAALVERLNLLLLAGQMSAELRQAVLDAVGSVAGTDAAAPVNRAKVAALLVLASPEFVVQR